MPPISRPASSTYWAPCSNRQRRLSEIPTNKINYLITRNSEGDVSSTASTSISRHYVDPWDLENYAFMKRHSTTDAETDYIVRSTPALESSQSDFYYVPHYQYPDTDYDAGTRQFSPYLQDPTQNFSVGLVNGVEEEDFYNERFELHSNRYSGNSEDAKCYIDQPSRTKFRPTSCLYSRTDAGDSCEDYDSAALYSDDSTAIGSSGSYNQRIECQLYSPSVMLRRAPSDHSEQSLVYVYETGSRKRKMALPKGNLVGAQGGSVPAATLLRRHSTNSHLTTTHRSRRTMHGQLVSGCYPSKFSNTDPSYIMASHDDLQHPYYDIYCSKPIQVTPHHFGLSKID
ncbi:uncharacterized protein LOC110835076 isoform X2 [Zootermopsis nevadensis]|uniref:uncharacterized protein LOC110835076 isoform X2 n=1 Tax=Zootermopsis nevadensis TaxID=136037 RepID=UPI000B8E2399|nr:uncharacterized protein LOC110835076 isoform X2 [Zootermopsis nevadensis]